jgi:hypothetical protein
MERLTPTKIKNMNLQDLRYLLRSAKRMQVQSIAITVVLPLLVLSDLYRAESLQGLHVLGVIFAARIVMGMWKDYGTLEADKELLRDRIAVWEAEHES